MSVIATASPAKHGSLHTTKSGGLSTNCKSILTEQYQRLGSKHNNDLDLIEDLRTFIKVKCHIEKDYCNAIIKLVTSHQSKKYPQFKYETEHDEKLVSLFALALANANCFSFFFPPHCRSIYSVWKMYLDELDKVTKNRLLQFEQITPYVDNLKQMKSHKAHIGKKVLDTHLK